MFLLLKLYWQIFQATTQTSSHKPDMLHWIRWGAVKGGRSWWVGTKAKLHHLRSQRLRSGGARPIRRKHEAPSLIQNKITSWVMTDKEIYSVLCDTSAAGFWRFRTIYFGLKPDCNVAEGLTVDVRGRVILASWVHASAKNWKTKIQWQVWPGHPWQWIRE